MNVKDKPAVQERIQGLELLDHGNLVELSTVDVSATFYKSHFDSLSRHFFDLEADYLQARQGQRPQRTTQNYQAKLYEKTLKKIHKASERNSVSYVRWLAVGTITWLKLFIDHEDVVETVIDYFFNLSDTELSAETTQRSRQMLLWQLYCVKEFTEKVKTDFDGISA